MTNEGLQIGLAMTEMINLFQDIGMLLATVDEILENKQFIPLKGTTAISDSSDSINFPKKWIPDTIYRCYKHPADPQHIVGFVSILLVERDTNEWKKQSGHFSEPLITIGWAKFSQDVSPEFCSWLPKMYLWSQTKVEGKIGYIRNNFSDAKKPAGRVQERCLAVPLADVHTTEDLFQQLINPYIDNMWPTL